MDSLDTADRWTTDWTAAGADELPDLIELRRAIHADPEVGLHCPRTTDKAKAALAGLPLEIREGPSTTGFVAILRGGRGAAGDNGRTVLLRGDMDALPMQEETGLPFASRNAGAMHACGHDSHTAMLVGAARALCARADSLPGTVVFMFQPGRRGASRRAVHDRRWAARRSGARRGVRAPHLAQHAVGAGGRAGGGDAGVGGHAACDDHRARRACGDAAGRDRPDPDRVRDRDRVCRPFIGRRIAVTDPAVLSITKINAGTAHNVIPGEATMLGTLRTLSEETRATMHAAFHRIVEHVALAHGAVGVARIETGYPVTMNDPRGAALVERAAIALGGAHGYHQMPAPLMGAEDFSYVLRQTPGAMAFIGVAPEGTDPATNPPLHNTRMTIDEAVMAKGVALHCSVAERFLHAGFDG